MYTQRRRQPTDRDSLNDMARELRDYIICIEQMKQLYLVRHKDSTSDEDRAFFARLIAELDDNRTRNQNQLLGIIDRITRGRQSS